MSLEQKLEENTLAIKALTAAIKGHLQGQNAMASEPPNPGEHLYDTVLSEFTALQSLDHVAAEVVLRNYEVESVNQIPANKYSLFLDSLADARERVVKKLADSQESTIAPIAETSSQEPASAQDATTGGDVGKKPEQDAHFAETTSISAGDADTTTEPATVKNSTADKPVFTEYQQVADEFLKLVKDKGRDAAIELLTAYGVKTAKELKPEQYQAFGEDVLRILGDSLV